MIQGTPFHVVAGVPGRSEPACLSTPRPAPALPLAGCGISCPATATCAKGVCLCPAGKRAQPSRLARRRHGCCCCPQAPAALTSRSLSPAITGENLVPIAYDNGYLNQRCVRAQCAALDPAAGLRIDNATLEQNNVYFTFSLGVAPLATASNVVSRVVKVGDVSNSMQL